MQKGELHGSSFLVREWVEWGSGEPRAKSNEGRVIEWAKME